jgi:hypothetical protein
MTWLRKADDALLQQVDDELILLNLTSEQYYALNDTGCRFLTVCLESADLEQAIRTLASEFQVSDPTVRSDLMILIDGLRSRGLVITE